MSRPTETRPNSQIRTVSRSTRSPNRHLSFGLGVHRCLGAHVARQIFRVMIGEVLNRIPDYQIDESGVREYIGGTSTTGLWSLPATFAPGPGLNTPQPW